MLKISYAGCFGLSPAISMQFTFKMREIVKNSLNPLFWGFKVVQSHRCWYL